ncbi:MAG: long-chain-acyl-CoA synthetase [Maricaulaceae bacterium]|nr:long-chain-acyl-CoA synthetase [Maricaulaceae bacterium]
MALLRGLKRELLYLKTLLKIQRLMRWIRPDGDVLLPDHLEQVADAHSHRTAFLTEDGGEITYAAYEGYANQVANWALAQGLKAGDSVALYMNNRWEYIAIWFGLSKVGVTAALLNNQVTGASLAHGVNISGASHAIVEGELAGAWKSAADALARPVTAWGTDGGFAGTEDFDSALNAVSAARPPRDHRAHLKPRDPCMMMYTSGTTGLPKAAVVAHTRALYYLNVFSTAAEAGPEDRMMMVLPLYHATGGLCGVGCAISHGGALIVRKRFSASAFWPDAVKNGATLFMYVGELCRFLLVAPETAEEKRHAIRCIIGNGLRPEVWERFVARFRIPRVMEFYGATEGNVGLANFDSRPGAIGRVPPWLKHRFNIKLVRFDPETETPVRGPDGRCIEAAIGEAGEAVGRIDPKDARFRFDGYGDKAETEKKILRDAFRPGDAWFRTGDLLRRDREGYFYFVDRVGDTFRWKSENVSTNEVAEAIGLFPGVAQANVYGVSIAGYPGRAGMAALTVTEGFDMQALRAHLHAALPAYARPLFLRIQGEADTTGTFKLKKVDLVKDGFDPQRIKDPVWFDHPSEGAYVHLDAATYKAIQSGEVRV